MRSRRDYQRAFAVVREAIHEWDPYGLLAAGAPPDEFDSEVAAVVRQISRVQSSRDAAHVVAGVFSSSFAPERFTPEQCQEIGEKLYQAFKKNRLLDIASSSGLE